MNVDENLVSIITPTFNSERFINDTIISILNQSYQHWELLITDDFSEDKTILIIEKFAKKDSRIKLFKLNENLGAGAARNNSIKNAKGRYIAFCDSDDQWKFNKLEIQVDFLKKRKLAFTYSSYEVISETGKFVKVIHPPASITHKSILKNNYVGCLTAIYDSKKLGKIYMPTIRKRQDWVLWIIILKKIKITQGIKKNLAVYRTRSNSISRNKIEMVIYNWKIYNEILKFNKSKSFILILRFLFYYAVKKTK